MPAFVANEHVAFALGVGRRALDALLDLAPSKQRGYGPVSTLAARPALQRVVGESELRLRAIRALAITCYEQAWAIVCAGQTLPPRLLVIDVLDDQGRPDRLRLPLYDGLIGDAEAVWALLIGSLRLLGAAYADVVEFIADGAEWMWHRVERLSRLAEIPAAKLVEVLDFSHVSQYLYETLATCRHMTKAQRQALYKRLRHALRHQADGVEVVREALGPLATRQRGKAITRAMRYVEAHAHRMRYVTLEARKLPIGSGQVESAVRRVVNLRFKAPGSFWRETTVSGLMHLRAAFKAGRWDEVISGVLTGTCHTPSFEPVGNAATQRSVAAQERETPQTFVKPRKKAA